MDRAETSHEINYLCGLSIMKQLERQLLFLMCMFSCHLLGFNRFDQRGSSNALAKLVAEFGRP